MLDITAVTSGQTLYEQSHAFANNVYREQLHTSACTRPDVFLVAHDGHMVTGCLGLNHTVRGELFTSDARLSAYRSNVAPSTRLCDQAFFAVVRKIAAPALILATAAYAEMHGIDRIVYAGIKSSCRMIETFGFTVDMIGETSIAALPQANQNTYRFWQDAFRPVTYVLHTQGATDRLQAFAHRHSKRVRYCAISDMALCA